MEIGGYMGKLFGVLFYGFMIYAAFDGSLKSEGPIVALGMACFGFLKLKALLSADDAPAPDHQSDSPVKISQG